MKSARAALYNFLALAYLRPPDEDFLELAREISGRTPRKHVHRMVTSDLAARHTWLFSFNVYPYASVFLDPSGMLAAPWSSFVTSVYAALGLEVRSGVELAAGDHLAAQLEAVATLLEREAAAAGELEAVRARHAQRVLLLGHLLPWLPAFTGAVRRLDQGFYGEVAALTRELLLEHACELLMDEVAPPFFFPEDGGGEVAAGATPSPARDSGDALEELRALLTPARSGMFLSREDITRLGRRVELPVRFAERRLMLQNLVVSAADRGDLALLFAELRREALSQAKNLLIWRRTVPLLAPIWEGWLTRLLATRKRLEALSDDVREAVWRERR